MFLYIFFKFKKTKHLVSRKIKILLFFTSGRSKEFENILTIVEIKKK